jgi:hypothetical protein
LWAGVDVYEFLVDMVGVDELMSGKRAERKRLRASPRAPPGPRAGVARDCFGCLLTRGCNPHRNRRAWRRPQRLQEVVSGDAMVVPSSGIDKTEAFLEPFAPMDESK